MAFGIGPMGLVVSVPDSPVLAQQVEERTRTNVDGTSTVETLSAQIHRDRAGRIRIEWRVSGDSDGQSGVAYVIDPVARSAAVLFLEQKIAQYLVAPHAASGEFQVAFPAIGTPPSPAAKSRSETEKLGVRVIEGMEFEGARTIQIFADSMTIVREEWHSRKFGLTALIAAAGPSWRHEARLLDLREHEPDPKLFFIPPDFAVRDH